MLKLVAVFVVLGALAAGVFVAPIRGRTVADRWNAAAGPAEFARNAWDEGRAAVSGEPRAPVPRPSALPQATKRSRPAAPAARRDASRQVPSPVPAEHHTDEDRAALDRLLSERAR